MHHVPCGKWPHVASHSKCIGPWSKAMGCVCLYLKASPQWEAADAEIKVPSGENTELKRSPFKAWSKSVPSHTCYAYCQGFLPCLFLPFHSPAFFQNLSRYLPCWLWLTHGSCVGPQNKIGHPVRCRFLCWVPTEYKKSFRNWHVLWWLVKWLT